MHRLVSSTLLACSTALFISSQSVAADVDAAAAQALAKQNDCFKCHALDKTKKGPSYKKIAEKYRDKDKAESKDKLIKNITTGPKVKMEDGTEEDHKIIKTRDPKKLDNLANWILSM